MAQMDKAASDIVKLREAFRLLRQAKLNESEAIFRLLLLSDKAGARAKSGLGIIELEKGNRQRAEKLFRAATQSGEPVAEAYYGLGVIYETNDPGYARAQYEIALRINPKHVGSLARMKKLRIMGQPGPLPVNDRERETAPVRPRGRQYPPTSFGGDDSSEAAVFGNARHRTESRGGLHQSIREASNIVGGIIFLLGVVFVIVMFFVNS